MVDASSIGAAVREAISSAAVGLREDVREALREATELETSERGKRVIQMLVDNAAISERDRVPLCQDTGTAWVWVELGSEVCLGGDIHAEVDAAISEAQAQGLLRASVVGDALFGRENTGDNTPGFVDVSFRPGTGATVNVMLKGGGSDNASALFMLDPSEGEAGVRRVVVETVRANAASACPPLVIGVAVGSTFDKAPVLAKRAILRRVGAPAFSERAAALEKELLDAVNATGIGPGGLGGRSTALAVHLVTAPCHIASLPVAVNLGCSAVRTASVELA